MPTTLLFHKNPTPTMPPCDFASQIRAFVPGLPCDFPEIHSHKTQPLIKNWLRSVIFRVVSVHQSSSAAPVLFLRLPSSPSLKSARRAAPFFSEIRSTVLHNDSRQKPPAPQPPPPTLTNQSHLSKIGFVPQKALPESPPSAPSTSTPAQYPDAAGTPCAPPQSSHRAHQSSTDHTAPINLRSK